jgi:hypothetical protein
MTCCGTECADLMTNASHCGACSNDCLQGEVCRNGTCYPGCNDSSDCNGLTCCEGICVDLEGNNSHCGSCNHSCDSGETCVAGLCRCGATGPDCASAEICCGTTCHNPLTDDNHCGVCDVGCADNSSCINGSCQCSQGYGDCDGDPSNGCEASLNDDDRNCGACALSCDDGESCESGSCSCGGTGPDCVGGLSCCGTACFDLQADESNCGECGVACGQDEECVSGICATATVCDCNYECDKDLGQVCERTIRRCVVGEQSRVCTDDCDCYTGETCLDGWCGTCRGRAPSVLCWLHLRISSMRPRGYCMSIGCRLRGIPINSLLRHRERGMCRVRGRLALRQ